MNLPAPYRYTPLTSADARRLWEFEHWAFPSTVNLDLQSQTPYPVAPERMRAVVAGEDEQIVANFGSHPFARFPVPGGELPTGGLTNVGVHPAHRRRGLLRAMIADHFAETVTRFEALSVLFAAESSIYGRFGYGVASRDVRVTVPRGAALRSQLADFLPDDDSALTVRIETRSAAHNDIIDAVHAGAGQNVGGTGLNRPGWVTRQTPELHALWHDLTELDPNAEAQRIVIVERSGVPVGYTTLRRKSQWSPAGPTGEVNAGEVVALDPAASRKLWQVILDLDLTSKTTAFMIPTDDPIVNLLEQVRTVSPTVVDNLWLRIIDLPTALAGRQYQADVSATIAVTDQLLPQNAGTWQLRASAFGPAEVTRAPADQSPDFSLDIRDLGAVYLGDASLGELAAAGLVRVHNPAIFVRASAAFSWPHKPVCSWVF